MGDQSLLQEAFFAVLQNAVEASPAGGKIRAAVKRRGKFFDVVVEDEGQGIDPKHLDTIFEPFFTTKGAEGTGLGLSAAMRILQKHGGSIEAQNGARGACFTLTFPAA